MGPSVQSSKCSWVVSKEASCNSCVWGNAQGHQEHIVPFTQCIPCIYIDRTSSQAFLWNAFFSGFAWGSCFAVWLLDWVCSFVYHSCFLFRGEEYWIQDPDIGPHSALDWQITSLMFSQFRRQRPHWLEDLSMDPTIQRGTGTVYIQTFKFHNKLTN